MALEVAATPTVQAYKEGRRWVRAVPHQWLLVRNGRDGQFGEIDAAFGVPSNDDGGPSTTSGAEGEPGLETETALLPPPARDLYDLISAKNWHRSIRLCQSDPRLAQYVSEDNETGATCLFLACQSQPPVRAIRCLISAYPEAARIGCSESDSSNEGKDEATSSLLLPLHMACRCNASLPVLQVLLEAYPQAATTPGVPYAVNELFKNRESFENSKKAPASNVYKSVFWQKVRMLLEAMARCQEQSPVLHAAVQTGLPEVLDFALDHGPSVSQTAQRNHNALAPLHVALLMEASPTGSGLASVTASSNSNSNSVMTMVTRLLQADPSTALLPAPQNRYPLHLALSHLTSSGSSTALAAVILKVLQAAPTVAAMADPHSGLFPFQLAASHLCTSADVVDIEVIYRLLRTHPSVLRSCCVATTQKQVVSLPCSGVEQSLDSGSLDVENTNERDESNSHSPSAIRLQDFFQGLDHSSASSKRHRESSTLALALDSASFLSETESLAATTQDECAEEVAERFDDDPLIQSINSMCSGALLLLTSMFHPQNR